MDHFSAPTHTETEVTPQECTCHAVFHLFLSDDRTQDSDTTTAHIKRINELLKQRNIMSNTLIKICENTYGCAEHHRCDTSLYLISMLEQDFSVIIDSGISEIVYGRKVVDGLNVIYKKFRFQFMSTVKLMGTKCYNTQMVMHTGTCKSDVSLDSGFQKHLSTSARKHRVIDQGKYKKGQVFRSGQKGNIMLRIILA